MKNLLLKTLTILTLLIILISNFSYATNSNLKSSLTRLFGSNIKIETITNNEYGEGSSTTTYTPPTELTITDSQIQMKQIEEDQTYTFSIDYTLDDTLATFSMDSNVMEFIKDSTTEEEQAFSLLALLFLQNQCMQFSFLATADAYDIDLEVANSYFSQLMNVTSEAVEDETTGYTTQTYENNLFYYVLQYNTNTSDMKSSIEIDLIELSKVNENSLDGTVTSTITFLSSPSDEVPNENTQTNVVENNVVENNIVSNTINNTSDNNSIENTNTTTTTNNVIHIGKDNTVANTVLPATGSKKASYIILFAIATTLFFYSKRKYYKGI